MERIPAAASHISHLSLSPLFPPLILLACLPFFMKPPALPFWEGGRSVATVTGTGIQSNFPSPIPQFHHSILLILSLRGEEKGEGKVLPMAWADNMAWCGI